MATVAEHVEAYPVRQTPRVLDAATKLDIYHALIAGRLTQQEAADRYGIDRSTVARIRRTADDAAAEALARSRPGRPPHRSRTAVPAVTRRLIELEQVVQAQQAELDALRGLSQ